jgi:acetyl esterase/lipase
LLSHLAERGWICVSINYQLSPRHTWPDHIVDVKRAIAWIKDNIGRYGGDPDFVAIIGGSAFVTPDAPPFFVLHGRNDTFIPVEQAQSFVSRLREVSSQPVVYAELPLAQHAFDAFGSTRATHAAVAPERFLAEIHGARKPVG